MKKSFIIIQARTGSTRLPNKVMAVIKGKPLIWHLVNRLKHSKLPLEIIIATTNDKNDIKIINFANQMNLKYYTGSVDDVLDRFYQAALKFKAETIIRITGDCPLIDPEILDQVILQFLEDDSDFTSNTHPPTYPDGLDVEVFSFEALKKAWNEAKLASEREHVTSYIWNHPEIFKLTNVYNTEDLHKLRWTVDEEKDLEFVKLIFDNLFPKKEIFLMDDILKLLKRKPELMKINNQIIRDEGYLKSLENDRKIE